MIAADNPNLIEINAVYGSGSAESIIEAALIQTNIMLNLRDESKISGPQAEYYSEVIFEACKILSLPELGDMFNNILAGKYGKFYGNVDPMELTRWCREYVRSRSKIILEDKELYRREEARLYGDKPKGEDNSPPATPEMMKQLSAKIGQGMKKIY
jgi:hypothetical protein